MKMPRDDIPAADVVETAYEMLCTGVGTLARHAILPYVICFGAFVFVGYTDHQIRYLFLRLDAFSEILFLAVAQSAALVLAVVSCIPLTIRANRLFFLGPEAMRSHGLPEFGRAGPRLVIFVLLTFSLLWLPSEVSRVLYDYSSFIAVRLDPWRVEGSYNELSLLFFWLFVFVHTRCFFFYPVLSMGGGLSFRRRWLETKGNFWHMLGLAMVLNAPLLLAFGISKWAAGGFDVDFRNLGDFQLGWLKILGYGFASAIFVSVRLLESFGFAAAYAALAGQPAVALGESAALKEQGVAVLE